jgi:hypothetical protein
MFMVPVEVMIIDNIIYHFKLGETKRFKIHSLAISPFDDLVWPGIPNWEQER